LKIGERFRGLLGVRVNYFDDSKAALFQRRRDAVRIAHRIVERRKTPVLGIADDKRSAACAGEFSIPSKRRRPQHVERTAKAERGRRARPRQHYAARNRSGSARTARQPTVAAYAIERLNGDRWLIGQRWGL